MEDMNSARQNVLVTGATGFIGTRLVNALCAQGYRVRALVRSPSPLLPEAVEQVRGDLLEPLGTHDACRGIDTAYYLVHAMAGGRSGFQSRDRLAAQNFVAAAEKAGVKRVIYLGGLGETGPELSEHLASRREVAEILGEASFATTILRAAVIIGAGGASFEMIRSLVESLPVMITPRWVSTRCQPIAVGDVIRYLVGCLKEEQTADQTFDIGGPEILSYLEMMKRFGRIRNKSQLIIPVPFLTPKLSSYWVALITPVKPSISMPLIEGVKNEVVCRDNRIREFINFEPTPYDEAIRIALREVGEP
jgi:uncharacterized protein YbjT (DUF2867 family)